MISHGGLTEIGDEKTVNSLGISKAQFMALPDEYQKALILSHWEMIHKQEKENTNRLNLFMNQTIDEVVKKKVLSIFKRNK